MSLNDSPLGFYTSSSQSQIYDDEWLTFIFVRKMESEREEMSIKDENGGRRGKRGRKGERIFFSFHIPFVLSFCPGSWNP